MCFAQSSQHFPQSRPFGYIHFRGNGMRKKIHVKLNLNMCIAIERCAMLMLDITFTTRTLLALAKYSTHFEGAFTASWLSLS